MFLYSLKQFYCIYTIQNIVPDMPILMSDHKIQAYSLQLVWYNHNVSQVHKYNRYHKQNPLSFTEIVLQQNHRILIFVGGNRRSPSSETSTKPFLKPLVLLFWILGTWFSMDCNLPPSPGWSPIYVLTPTVIA